MFDKKVEFKCEQRFRNEWYCCLTGIYDDDLWPTWGAVGGTKKEATDNLIKSLKGELNYIMGLIDIISNSKDK